VKITSTVLSARTLISLSNEPEKQLSKNFSTGVRDSQFTPAHHFFF
jgi:hypothetical protein